MKKPSDLRIPFVWADRHSVLLDRCLYIPGYLESHASWEKIPWSSPLMFGNDHPCAIEYCSGNGQWICAKAKEFPEWNWIAVEKRFDRARKIWVRLHRENLSNLFVVCGEGVVFTRHYVPRQSIAKVFVNFPDPWPKLRHAKNRLIRSEFLDELDPIMQARAKVVLVTDDFPYASEMIQVFSSNPKWKPLFPSPHYVIDSPDYGNSFFFHLWKEKGRAIHHIEYELNS